MTEDLIQCAECGNDLHEASARYLEGSGDVCDECYYEHTDECVICQERFPSSKRSRFILVKTELAPSRMLPGIYRVIGYPFLISPLIGSASLMADYVSFTDRLPKPDREFELSGHICPGCALPYAKQFRKAYRGRFAQKAYTAERHAMEIAHTNHVLAEHPELLKDLEMDDECSIRELKELFKIPETATFFHEWLYFEHNGVKVFHAYRPSSQENPPSWLTLCPNPSSRNCRRSTTFDTSSLPNYDMRAQIKLDRHDPRKAEGCRKTIERAIEIGAITQSGVAPFTDPIWDACRKPKKSNL